MFQWRTPKDESPQESDAENTKSETIQIQSSCSEENCNEGIEEDKTDEKISSQPEAVKETTRPMYVVNPVENIFQGNPNLLPTTYQIHTLTQVDAAVSATCVGCQDALCESRCQFYKDLENSLIYTATAEEARLHIYLMDPLVWTNSVVQEKPYSSVLAEIVQQIRQKYVYPTYKGSDHAFVCLTENCINFGNAFAEALAKNQGSRAIFITVGSESSDLEWPCPLRVVYLEASADVALIQSRILTKATFMIQGRNRWICADQKHPPHHWKDITDKNVQTGAYMREYGFTICAIPKCGSSMLLALMRRMMHYSDWNQVGTGVNHGPSSGIRYVKRVNANDIRGLNEDLSFVSAAFVRHPIIRLLSGYLDKIYQKKEYSRVKGLKEYVHHLKRAPTFQDFANFLIDKHPNPNHLDQHFRIQSAFCNFRENEIDFVGKLERQMEEMREFGNSIGFWEAYGASGWGENGTHAFGESSYQSRKHDSGNLVWDYYTVPLMSKVFKYYKEDFIRFGFTMEEIYKTLPDSNVT